MQVLAHVTHEVKWAITASSSTELGHVPYVMKGFSGQPKYSPLVAHGAPDVQGKQTVRGCVEAPLYPIFYLL